ncbi:Orotidine 5'-phosphate decarboxylase domain-containing protein [Lipomyces oligophaga]|uniref:Orotidine 5'-phosphate decarboxylase domain-containing protein n=1 Tax=Lipomyces oligophaga TaxID=45792 RepID=UPI0034CF8978
MASVITSSYEKRLENHKSALARRLFSIMIEKQTNLCVSLDVSSKEELLGLVDSLGPYVCVFKTHIDIVDDFSYESVVDPLVALSKKHNFLIFEDRKFADIGSTVKSQYTSGTFHIARWAHITNAHALPGPGIVDGLKAGAKEAAPTGEDDARGLLLLAEMSSSGNLATGAYTEATVDLARANSDFVFGFIAMKKLGKPDEDFIIMTPGVGLDVKSDGLGQKYSTVDEVVSGGSDIVIVGRGIIGKGRDHVAEAIRYRSAGWSAYLARISN